MTASCRGSFTLARPTWGGNPSEGPYGKVLDPAQVTPFYASYPRTGNIQPLFTVSGASGSESVTLDAANNVDTVAVVSNVAADATGQLVVDVQAGAGNNSLAGSYYLGVLQIDVAIPDPGIPADFDGDGDVDGVDFLAWQSGYPTSTGATKADGDTDGDGDVDGVDFLTWQTWYPYP